MPAQSRKLICTGILISRVLLFPRQRNRVQPPEAFFDALPSALTDEVARAPHRLLINRAPATPFVVLRDMLVTRNLRGQLPVS